MIFTPVIGPNGSPEEQVSAGHGLTFTSNRYTLTASNTSPPAGMTGFREPNLNDQCAYAYFLDLQFSATPTNWRIEMGVNNFFDKATTWRNQQVGNLALDTFILQPSNGAGAIANDHLRILVPEIAGNISSVMIQLGATEQSHLISANFHRTIAVLQPTPRFRRAELSPPKRTEDGIDGRTHVTLQTDPIFSAEFYVETWENDRELLDMEGLAVIPKFAIWPAGLESAFTPNQPILYRRPAFTRNVVVTTSRGLTGIEGIDHPDGPASLRFSLEESV